MRPENRPDGRTRPSFIEQARRAQIVEAAAETVAEVGYARASLARIADRAGVSKSVISYHFAGGKDELLMQMVSTFFEDTWAHMSERIDAQTTAAGRIRAWVGSQMTYFSAHRTRFLAMVAIVDGHRLPDGSRPFADGMQQELDAVTEILREGQRDGEFRAFDASGFATIIIRATEGVLGRWAEDEETDLDAQTTVLLDFIDHAIRTEAP
ncbi:MAG: TetR/AcrR family transcriptional regulator [Solirubrobacteraceae bacterium]|nr:TetR/AcrR family transcriptional regulator [Solirubrobacteraceae bacterium]